LNLSYSKRYAPKIGEKNMTGIDFDEICYNLAEETGKEPNIVRAEIEGIAQRTNTSLLGALAKWKNDNLDKLGKSDYFITVLRKSPVREYVSQTRGPGKVADLDVAYTDGEGTYFNHTTIWNEALDPIYDLLDEGKSYKVRASLNDQGELRRFSDPEEAEAYEAPNIDDIEPPLLEDLDDSRQKIPERQRGISTFIRGWVGSLLLPQGGTEAIGFRVFDATGVVPLTVWFGGEYTRIPDDELDEIRRNVGEGTEVAVFGYVPKEGRFRMNAEKVWPMEG
jgi:hypothetical protein